jgi:hypothetical protein
MPTVVATIAVVSVMYAHVLVGCPVVELSFMLIPDIFTTNSTTIFLYSPPPSPAMEREPRAAEART